MKATKVVKYEDYLKLKNMFLDYINVIEESHCYSWTDAILKKYVTQDVPSVDIWWPEVGTQKSIYEDYFNYPHGGIGEKYLGIDYYSSAISKVEAINSLKKLNARSCLKCNRIDKHLCEHHEYPIEYGCDWFQY